MIYQLRSVNVDILTDRDIDMTNQIIPDVDTFYYYHLTFSPANNRIAHVHIVNSTIHNLHLHLDNSKISVNITNNVFTGSGIKISSTSTDLHQPVIIENSVFQGFYSKSIIEVLNTTNVYLHSCVFKNTKLAVLAEVDENESSGISCFNSKIELVDIFFLEVSFFPVAAFEKCTLTIYRLTMSGNSLLSQSFEKNSLLYLKHSEAIIEDSEFEDNTEVRCFWVFGGNTTLHNIMFISNNEVEYGRFMHATVNISNTSVVNNIHSTFYISKSTVYFSFCKFLNTSIPSRYYLMNIEESYINIIYCIFKELEGVISIYKSELFIGGSHFLQNKNTFQLISLESLLHISQCRFENNEQKNLGPDSGLIAGSAVIQDSVFDHNHVTPLVFGRSVEFANCVFNSNLAPSVFVEDGTVQIYNCSFNNNVFGNSPSYLTLVGVSRSQLTIHNCNFTNNSSPIGLGVIYMIEASYLLLENSIFVNNSYNVGAGAITAYENCTLKMSHNIFKNNKAANGGAIDLSEKSFMISDSCQFIGNTATLGGGAVMVRAHSSYSDNGSIFLNNSAVENNGGVAILLTEISNLIIESSIVESGGAISTTGHNLLKFENSIFENDSCTVEGGAIRAHRNSSLTVSGSIFRNNIALGADGGAIFLESESELITVSCQFLGNTAALGGGAVMVLDHSSYNDTGSTFTSNTASDNGRYTRCFLKLIIYF